MVKDSDPLAHAAGLPVSEVGGILRGEIKIGCGEGAIRAGTVFREKFQVLIETQGLSDQSPVAPFLDGKFQAAKGVVGIFPPGISALGGFEEFLRALRGVGGEEAGQVGGCCRIGQRARAVGHCGKHGVRILSEGFFKVTVLDTFRVGFLLDPTAHATFRCLCGFPDIQRPDRLVEKIGDAISRLGNMQLSIRKFRRERFGQSHEVPCATVVEDAAIVVCGIMPAALHSRHDGSVWVLI